MISMICLCHRDVIQKGRVLYSNGQQCVIIGLAGAISIYELPTVTIEMLFLPFFSLAKTRSNQFQRILRGKRQSTQGHLDGKATLWVSRQLNPMRPTRIREMPIAIPKKTNNIDPVQIGLHVFFYFLSDYLFGGYYLNLYFSTCLFQHRDSAAGTYLGAPQIRGLRCALS